MKSLWLDTFVWRLLWLSGVFRAWAKPFLAELVMDLEEEGLDREELLDKYRKKLDRITAGSSPAIR